MRKALTLAGTALATHAHASDSHSPALDTAMSSLVQRDTSFTTTLSAPLNVSAANMYASHSSHSSHRSHSSHSSHYSGSGGSYSSPSPRSYPIYTPSSTTTSSGSSTTSGSTGAADSNSGANAHSGATTTNSDANRAGTMPMPALGPGSAPTSTPARANQDQLKMMIMRVQTALYTRGYDPGAIDGELNEPTKGALRKYQIDRGLVVSGKMSTETLNALGISFSQ